MPPQPETGLPRGATSAVARSAMGLSARPRVPPTLPLPSTEGSGECVLQVDAQDDREGVDGAEAVRAGLDQRLAEQSEGR